MGVCVCVGYWYEIWVKQKRLKETVLGVNRILMTWTKRKGYLDEEGQQTGRRVFRFSGRSGEGSQQQWNGYGNALVKFIDVCILANWKPMKKND